MPDNQPDQTQTGPNCSRDAFLDGRVHVMQPKSGFRAGLDSVLLAASVNAQSTNILELGAGVGTVSCCALMDLPNAKATLVELQNQLITISKQNLENNNLSDRAKTIELDVTAKGAVRMAAGLKTDIFSSVIANPPFFDSSSGSHPPDQARATARHMPELDLDLWVKTAAACAAPKGEVIFIHASTTLPSLLNALTARFGNITILPIHSFADQAANRVLVRGIKGSRAPMTLLPPLILHAAAQREFLTYPDEIFRGRRRLDW